MQIPAHTGPPNVLDNNAVPIINEYSSLPEYFELLITESVVSLLVEEKNLYCHQYYSQQSTTRRHKWRDERLHCTDYPDGTWTEDFTEELLVYRWKYFFSKRM